MKVSFKEIADEGQFPRDAVADKTGGRNRRRAGIGCRPEKTANLGESGEFFI